MFRNRRNRKAAKNIDLTTTAGYAAAQWWASVLRDPQFDNGDDNP